MDSLNHSWDLSPEEAVQLQQQLRNKVDLQPLSKPVRYIAGMDISFNFGSKLFFGGIVVLDYPSMNVVEKAEARKEISFPYVPGLLSFREVPVLEEAWHKLESSPDVAILDGHGIAHPRRLGLATHFGLRVQCPSLGCAKNILAGTFEAPGKEAKAYSLIYDGPDGEVIGAAYRNKANTNPVFLSPGHLVALQDCLELFELLPGKYRVPPPTRQAHLWVNECRKAFYRSF